VAATGGAATTTEQGRAGRGEEEEKKKRRRRRIRRKRGDAMAELGFPREKAEEGARAVVGVRLLGIGHRP